MDVFFEQWTPVRSIPIEKGITTHALMPSPGSEYPPSTLLCDIALDHGRLVVRFASLVEIVNNTDVPVELLLCGGRVPSVEMSPVPPLGGRVSLPIHMTHKRLAARPYPIRADPPRDPPTGLPRDSTENGEFKQNYLEYQWYAGIDLQDHMSFTPETSETSETSGGSVDIPIHLNRIRGDSTTPDSPNADDTTDTTDTTTNVVHRHMPEIFSMSLRWEGFRTDGQRGANYVATFGSAGTVTNLLPCPLYVKLATSAMNAMNATSVTKATSATGSNTHRGPPPRHPPPIMVLSPTETLHLYASKGPKALECAKIALSLDGSRWSPSIEVASHQTRGARGARSARSARGGKGAAAKKKKKSAAAMDKHDKHIDFNTVEDRQVTLFRANLGNQRGGEGGGGGGGAGSTHSCSDQFGRG